MKTVMFFISLLLCCSLSAQPKYDFSQFEKESWSLVKQPTTWQAKDLFRVGAIGVGTFLAMQVDQPVRNRVLRDNQQYYNSAPIEGGRLWGELYTPVILFSGFSLYSLIADDAGARKIAYEIGQASLYAGVSTYLLKTMIGRARPYMNQGPKSLHPFSSLFFTQDYQSLPGGHATIAVVLSTVLSRNVHPIWLKVLAYVPAAFTVVSRVYQDKHWTSDQFLGVCLGYCIATWVIDIHEQEE